MKLRKIQSNKLSLCLVILAVGLAVILAVYNRQSILDYLALFRYKPPQQIALIAKEDDMTAYTKKVFYVNHPQIDSKSTFAGNCPNNSEQTVVLGCYHPDQRGIYILAVSNSQLYGIEQVTSAYETLHAIYQRLDSSQLKSLNSQLLSFEHHGLNNQTVQAQIAGFKKTEPQAVLNEMTSLFGTEVSNLPPALNSFYAKYFNNRQVLLNYYNDYQVAFSSRQQQITADDQQLSTWDNEVKADQSQLNYLLSQIDAQQATLNADQNSGNVNDYNANVASYNQKVDSYDSLVNGLSSLINQYNQLVVQRNSIALEEQQLVQAITSTPQKLSER